MQDGNSGVSIHHGNNFVLCALCTSISELRESKPTSSLQRSRSQLSTMELHTCFATYSRADGDAPTITHSLQFKVVRPHWLAFGATSNNKAILVIASLVPVPSLTFGTTKMHHQPRPCFLNTNLIIFRHYFNIYTHI